MPFAISLFVRPALFSNSPWNDVIKLPSITLLAEIPSVLAQAKIRLAAALLSQDPSCIKSPLKSPSVVNLYLKEY
ncbi:hypothetical protein TorRG33x02_297390 [Trema orientale]|uniref:Uncharacterized protein n=1 Tax=Trema orientale TaxID=63057 RepID=A0A2P5C4V0_TREOI|nr:hypothetical protein TorRG33x02_297390 [Trema orientale]